MNVRSYPPRTRIRLPHLWSHNRVPAGSQGRRGWHRPPGSGPQPVARACRRRDLSRMDARRTPNCMLPAQGQRDFSSARTVSTGQGARRTTRSAVLPSTRRLRPV